MARDKTKRRMTLKAMLTEAPGLDGVCRQLAALALAELEQDSPLGVRQGEQLRRALATAGDALDWTATAAHSEDAMADVSKDFMTMAKGGSRAMGRDLAKELAAKKVEVKQLTETLASAVKLAEDPDTAYPSDVTFSYTVRDAFTELVTKTETVTVTEPREATSAAAALERSMPARTKLADLMIIELKRKQRQLDVMTKNLSEFIQSARGLLQEVIANLQ
jgi:signal recognition particle subunit SEC65